MRKYMLSGQTPLLIRIEPVSIPIFWSPLSPAIRQHYIKGLLRLLIFFHWLSFVNQEHVVCSLQGSEHQSVNTVLDHRFLNLYTQDT